MDSVWLPGKVTKRNGSLFFFWPKRGKKERKKLEVWVLMVWVVLSNEFTSPVFCFRFDHSPDVSHSTLLVWSFFFFLKNVLEVLQSVIVMSASWVRCRKQQSHGLNERRDSAISFGRHLLACAVFLLFVVLLCICFYMFLVQSQKLIEICRSSEFLKFINHGSFIIFLL